MRASENQDQDIEPLAEVFAELKDTVDAVQARIVNRSGHLRETPTILSGDVSGSNRAATSRSSVCGQLDS